MPSPRTTVVLKEKSSTSCSATSSQGRLYLAWTDADRRLNTMSSTDGHEFRDKRTLPFESSKLQRVRTHGRAGARLSSGILDLTTAIENVPLPPVLAPGPRGVNMAWTDPVRHLHVQGPATSGHTVVSESCAQAPALGVWNDELILAWTDADRHINLVHTLQGTWSEPLRLDHASLYAPAICAVGRCVVVVWTGLDRHLNIMQTQGGSWSKPERLDETSLYAPAICAVGRNVVVAWTGTDHHVHLQVLGPSGGAPVELAATSRHGPALCVHDDELVVTWTGNDRRVNISHRHLPA